MNKKLKRLPRTDSGDFKDVFYANNHKYIIRTQEEGIGAYRYSVFKSRSTLALFDIEPALLIKNIQELGPLITKAYKTDNLSKPMLFLQSMLDGVNRMKQEYNYLFYACCLFIVREGEDMTKFDLSVQGQKIADWNKEQYHEGDFKELLKKKVVEFS